MVIFPFLQAYVSVFCIHISSPAIPIPAKSRIFVIFIDFFSFCMNNPVFSVFLTFFDLFVF